MNLFMDTGIGEFVLLVAFFVMLILISICDLYKKEIPDLFCGIISAIGILAIFIIKDIKIWERLLGMIAISLPMLILSLVYKKSFGGGDIKLMAAGGIFLGAKLVVVAAFLGLIITGIYIFIAKIAGNKEIKNGIALAPCISIGMIESCMFGIQLWNRLI